MINNEIKDKKHAIMMNSMIRNISKDFFIEGTKIDTIKTEYYYTNYSNVGFFDIICKVRSPSAKEFIYIFEIKPKIFDLGEDIRQIHRYIAYIRSNKDGIFNLIASNSSILDSIVCFLVLLMTKENCIFFYEFIHILANSEINYIIFLDPDMDSVYMIDIKQELDLLLNTDADKYVYLFNRRLWKEYEENE